MPPLGYRSSVPSEEVMTARLHAMSPLSPKIRNLVEGGGWNAFLYAPRDNPNLKFHNFIRGSRHLLEQKLAYYGKRCRYCEVELFVGFNMSWDHAIPLSRGGKNIVSNLVPACRSCNSGKRDRTIFEYLGIIRG